MKAIMNITDPADFDFCNVKGDLCNVVMFNSISMNFLFSLSDSLYQVTKAACSDSMTISDEAWDGLMMTPPIPLVEPYYSCVLFVINRI